MYRITISILVVGIIFLNLSTNAVGADSTKLTVKPVSPTSKIKAPVSIAAPSPTPAPAVETTKSVPDVAPKPVKKPTAPKQISSIPKPAKSPAVSSLPKVKLKSPQASLPQGVQQNNLPKIQVPADLGRSTKIPGSAGKDMTKTNNIGSRLPEGHTSPTGGFGSRNSAAGLTKGVGRRDGIGSVQDEFADQMRPTMRTGKGAQREGDETEEFILGDYKFKDIPASEAKDTRDGLNSGKISEADAIILLEPYLDTSEDDNKRNKDGKPTKGSTTEERIADDGPGEGGPGGPVDPNRVRGIFAGSPGIRFAPGEEPSESGTVDPSLLGTIQSSKTQVNTVDGIDYNSDNFEDLSKRAQEAIKNQGQGNPVSD